MKRKLISFLEKACLLLLHSLPDGNLWLFWKAEQSLKSIFVSAEHFVGTRSDIARCSSFFRLPTKRKAAKAQVCTSEIKVFLFMDLSSSDKKKVKREKFTWIASALRLIYLHLLSLVSSSEQPHAEHYLTRAFSLCKKSIQCEVKNGGSEKERDRVAEVRNDSLEFNVTQINRRWHWFVRVWRLLYVRKQCQLSH